MKCRVLRISNEIEMSASPRTGMDQKVKTGNLHVMVPCFDSSLPDQYFWEDY